MVASHEFGVVYTPSNVLADPESSEDIQRLIESGQIKYIRLTWLDWTSLIRYRIIPLKYFAKLLKSNRPSISLASCLFGLVNVSLADGWSPIGEDLYVPDMSTMRRSGHAANTVTVMGFYQTKVPHPQTGFVHPYCPRTILQNVVERARTIANAEYLIGVETEFILLSGTNPITAVNSAQFSTSAKLPAGSREETVLLEIAEALDAANIELQMYHAEAAPGQYEIVTGPLQPLEAADAYVVTRDTIVNIAAKHGLRATLAPRVYNDTCGSAMHMHASVHSRDGSVPKGADLNQLETSFLAGLMKYLPETQAFTQPLPASYARVLDGVWSGGTYVSWGTENREAPVRLCHPASPRSRNFEIRSIDGLCNVYLAMAALFGATTKAIIEKEPLTVQDFGDDSAAALSEADRKAKGCVKRMSLTWEEARQNLTQSNAMAETFGADMIEKYLSTNKLWQSSMIADGEEREMIKLVETY